MAFTSIDEVPKDLRIHQLVPLTLDQINRLHDIFHSIQAVDPWPIAWATFEKIYWNDGTKWILRKTSQNSELTSAGSCFCGKHKDEFKEGDLGAHDDGDDEDEEYLGPIANDSYPLTDLTRPWDGAAAVARLRKFVGGPDKDTANFTKYRTFFTWYDSDNPTNFGSYKLPHHDIINGKAVTVGRGVFAAMGALLGARGGVNIPEADKQGTYNHLVNHYKQIGREPPAFNLNDSLVQALDALGEDNPIYWKLLGEDTPWSGTYDHLTEDVVGDPDERHLAVLEQDITITVVELGKDDKKAKVAIIKGLALAEGEWKGIFYSFNEIRMTADGLIGQRVHFNHNNETSEQVKGFVTGVSIDTTRKGVIAESMVFDPLFVNLVEKGQLKISNDEGGIGYSVQVMFKPQNRGRGLSPAATNLSYGELTITGSPACKICRLADGHVEELSQESDMSGKEKKTPSDSPGDPAELNGAEDLDRHGKEVLNALQQAMTIATSAGLPASVMSAIQKAMDAVMAIEAPAGDSASEKKKNAEEEPAQVPSQETKDNDASGDKEQPAPAPPAQPAAELSEDSSESNDGSTVNLSEQIATAVAAAVEPVKEQFEKQIANLEAEKAQLESDRNKQWAEERTDELMQVGAVIPVNRDKMVAHLSTLDREEAEGLVDMLSMQVGSGLFGETAQEGLELGELSDEEASAIGSFDYDPTDKDNVIT